MHREIVTLNLRNFKIKEQNGRQLGTIKNKTRWKNCRKAKKLYFLNTDIGNLYIKEKIMIFFHFKHFLWMLRLLLQPSKKISKTKTFFSLHYI